ncbi:hypothetical protein [Gynuella sunshinyii]|uniref:Peptidase S8/S53 domain-containing protein n=1 Tax=Gynuella sunshinyii YC6258 TaxID=1445510 RepID=A0A0C5VFA4_9GAMM|nr:hypothetical protein [Gynuella sunshinyii]AJQ97950.1 hypothetical Protein YC6258_05926 [Gynuella sunshinyii YC6258]
MKRLFLGLAITLLLHGCDNSSDDGDVVVIPPPDDNPTKPALDYSNTGDKYLPGVRAVVAQIHDFLDTLPDCNDNPAGMENADLCDTGEYSIQEVLFPDAQKVGEVRWWSSQKMVNDVTISRQANSGAELSNPKVLLIDSGVASAALRYPQRMLAMYDWVFETEDNTLRVGYQHTTATVQTSKARYQIRAEILGKTDAFVPSTELTRELDRTRFAKLPTDYNGDTHGSLTLNLLADYIPAAEFVTLDSFGKIVFPDQVLCSLSDTVVDSYVDYTISVLTDIIERHHIDYVNLSAGLIKQDFKDKLLGVCRLQSYESKDVLRLQQAYTRILVGIANQTVLVQAGPNGAAYRMTTSEDGQDPASEYYADCMDIDNRFRTGYLIQSYLNDGSLPVLPSEGVSYSNGYDDLVKPSQLEIKGCVDGYFNTGWRENYADLPSFGHYPILYGEDGTNAGPMSSMKTSFISGVGIAYIEYIARTRDISRSDALKSLKERKVDADTPWLMDPMRHAELPVCVDFPDACENWDSFSL